MKRGYLPAVTDPEVGAIVKEIAAFEDLRIELLRRVDGITDREVTAVELRRDLGFTQSGIRLSEKSKFFAPAAQKRGGRATYNLREALRFRLQLPGLAALPTVRTVRKGMRAPKILLHAVWMLVQRSYKHGVHRIAA